jgi:hypothetical protein
MSKKMNFIKSIVDRNFCESCIIIKQKVESHNHFVIFDKHSLNLMWSDFVELSISNDKIRYFVTFLCDFIKRSMIYMLRDKSNTFETFKHFQLHNEHEDNRIWRLRTSWKKKYSNNEFDDYRFKHDIEWELIVSKIFEQNEIVKRLKQIIMLMINIIFKNINLNVKWWIELIKIINYFRNRSSIIDKSIIFYEVDTKKNSFSLIFVESKQSTNVIYHYLSNDHYFVQFQILFFIFSSRRRQRQRQQYEIFQKILCDTSLSNTKMILSITSVRNNRMFHFIDNFHSTFTFCFVFISFRSRWRYSLYIWDQHLSETWKFVDRWRFWSTIFV